jgi:hypothetical protein
MYCYLATTNIYSSKLKSKCDLEKTLQLIYGLDPFTLNLKVLMNGYNRINFYIVTLATELRLG